ncbi:MAG: hypothetical protein US49_C0001G0216 [candidate division TM6 bacterium GW2011_GWF2_37_49]|nr:MAG: hypothetical protein US49_C0001G0216 [candidate division TM6 bacterium GW2011_GWF2_37_49]
MSNYFMKNGMFVVLLVLGSMSSANFIKAAAMASPEPMPTEVDEQSAMVVEQQIQSEIQATQEKKLKRTVHLDLLCGIINSPLGDSCTLRGRSGGEYTYCYQWDTEACKLCIWNTNCSCFFYTLSNKELAIYHNSAIEEYKKRKASYCPDQVVLENFKVLISALAAIFQSQTSK